MSSNSSLPIQYILEESRDQLKNREYHKFIGKVSQMSLKVQFIKNLSLIEFTL